MPFARDHSSSSSKVLLIGWACGSAGRDPFDQAVFFDSHLTAKAHDRQKPLAAQFIGPLERYAEAFGYFIHVQQADLRPPVVFGFGKENRVHVFLIPEFPQARKRVATGANVGSPTRLGNSQTCLRMTSWQDN